MDLVGQFWEFRMAERAIGILIRRPAAALLCSARYLLRAEFGI